MKLDELLYEIYKKCSHCTEKQNNENSFNIKSLQLWNDKQDKKVYTS